MQKLIADEADSLIFLKTHNILGMDNGYPLINLNVTSGAIYILRNPLDVVISMANHNGCSIDCAIEIINKKNFRTHTTNSAAYEVYGSWSQNVESWTRKKHKSLFIMRYEDMIKNTECTFINLANHLLLYPTKCQLKKAIENSSFDVLRRQENESSFIEKPKKSKKFFCSGKIDEWKNILTDRQIRKIINNHKEQMERFGYYPL